MKSSPCLSFDATIICNNIPEDSFMTWWISCFWFKVPSPVVVADKPRIYLYILSPFWSLFNPSPGSTFTPYGYVLVVSYRNSLFLFGHSLKYLWSLSYLHKILDALCFLRLVFVHAIPSSHYFVLNAVHALHIMFGYLPRSTLLPFCKIAHNSVGQVF